MLLFNREKNSQSSCKCTTQQHSALPILLAQSTQAQKQQSSIICGKYKDIEVICYNQIGMSILLIHAAISSYVVYYCLLHTYMMGGYVVKQKKGTCVVCKYGWRLVNTIWSMQLLMVDQIFHLDWVMIYTYMLLLCSYKICQLWLVNHMIFFIALNSKWILVVHTNM